MEEIVAAASNQTNTVPTYWEHLHVHDIVVQGPSYVVTQSLPHRATFVHLAPWCNFALALGENYTCSYW